MLEVVWFGREPDDLAGIEGGVAWAMRSSRSVQEPQDLHQIVKKAAANVVLKCPVAAQADQILLAPFLLLLSLNPFLGLPQDCCCPISTAMPMVLGLQAVGVVGLRSDHGLRYFEAQQSTGREQDVVSDWLVLDRDRQAVAGLLVAENFAMVVF